MYGFGAEIVESSLEKVRKLVERCDCLHGFMLSYGTGGGSGSGMGSKLLSKLYEAYTD